MGFHRFVSLGGVWLDDIQVGERLAHTRVLGGSVTFATLGARLFSADDPSTVSFVLRAGSDFPEHVVWMLRKWKTSMRVEWNENVPAARGLLRYGENNASKRSYQRLTDPLLTTVDNLTISEILKASCFHFFDNPLTVRMQVRELLALRAKHDAQQRIHIIWEPQVKHCVTDLLEEHLKTAALVHVFSPNHVELESLFSNTPPVHFDQARIEGRARHFLDYGIDVDGRGVIVVRAAEHGCLVMTRRMKPLWLPAVHQSDSNKVVDATGAGNAFLGGFAMGMLEMMDDVAEAAVYGQVAASFAIEQVGVPTVTGDGEAELWNDESVHDRLETYRETVRDLILECYGITAARSNIPKDHCSDENWAKRSASISKRKRHASGTQESRKAVHRSRHSGSQ